MHTIRLQSILLLPLWLSLGINTAGSKGFPPSWYKEIFSTVQTARIFPDDKTFADALPLADSAALLKEFKKNKTSPDLLRKWIHQRFQIPGSYQETKKFQKSVSVSTHIQHLWGTLLRERDTAVPYSSLIPLPYKYIVPGGRFREIYYWDSYFSMLGIAVSKRYDLIESMIKNFAYLIEHMGYIPNGNRTYFEGRSQPPFFSKMVALLAEEKGPQILAKYLPSLEKEYAFWMQGAEQAAIGKPYRRVVKLEKGITLNRYYSDIDGPRPEGYHIDIQAYQTLPPAKRDDFYRHLRSACESGWDFSSRWFAEGVELASIETMYIIPVDLNCLLYELETMLSKAYTFEERPLKAAAMQKAAAKRLASIRVYCWNDQVGSFVDYHWKRKQQQHKITAAALYPMWSKIATAEQAARQLQTTKNNLWAALGVATTTVTSGQQWDAPNGWAPLQWIHYKGLSNYGYQKEAVAMAKKWLEINEKIYYTTGKMMEKYNVITPGLLDGGGEYPNQDGFGWTNGVYQALKQNIMP